VWPTGSSGSAQLLVGLELTEPSRGAGFDEVEVDYVAGGDHDRAMLGWGFATCSITTAGHCPTTSVFDPRGIGNTIP
jgi:hypothetical protein